MSSFWPSVTISRGRRLNPPQVVTVSRLRSYEKTRGSRDGRRHTGRRSEDVADERFGAGLADRALQTLSELDLRRPAEDLARQRDVWLADLGVVGGQRLVHDL